MRKQIRKQINKIVNNENLKVSQIRFEVSIPEGVWGRCWGDVKDGQGIVFHRDILNIREFEKANNYPVWIIILHEIAHLKYKNHKKEFYDYLKKLQEKYYIERNILLNAYLKKENET